MPEKQDAADSVPSIAARDFCERFKAHTGVADCATCWDFQEAFDEARQRGRSEYEPDLAALRAENEKLRTALSEAAQEINCAGPVAHRIRVLKHKLQTREENLRARNAKLVEGMKNAKKSHYYCEDPWYSCPLAEDGCADDRMPENECSCGADEFNKKIDAILEEAS